MSFLRRALDFVLPSKCCYCRSSTGISEIPLFCPSCWSDFALLLGPVCPGCGMPFDSPEALICSPRHRCRSCREKPPSYDYALSVGQFEGPLREAIHQFKYRPCRALGKPLGEWMLRSVRILTNIDLLMPVPLHGKRLRQRGFNQSVLLAHRLSLHWNVPLSFDNLIRVRSTKPQVELTGLERIENVRGAFIVRRPREVESKHIVLIDDVFTTGATMNECSSVLKEAGAAQVTAFTLARAI